MEKTLSLTKQSLILMLGKGGGLLISFTVPLIIVRLTDQASFGTYKQFFLVFATLFLIEQLGMTQSIFYFVPGNKTKSIFIVQTYLYLVAVGLLSALLIFLLRDHLAGLLNNPALSQYAPFLAAYLFFQLGGSLLEVLPISESRIVLAAVIFFTTELFKSIFMLLPLFLTGSLHALFAGAAFFAFIRFSFSTFYIRKHFYRAFRKVSAESLKRHVSYALPLGMSMIFFVISLDLHSYIISFNFDPAVYAIFAVGIFYPPIIEVIESPIIEPMFVSMVRHVKAGDAHAVLNLWSNSIRKISLAFFPILAFCFVESKQIISVLFTDNYLASVPIFTVTIFRIFFAVFIPDNVIKAHGRTNYILAINIITLIFYAIALFVLIRVFGLIGAAFAMLANEIFSKTLLVNEARKILKLSITECLPWIHIGACLSVSFASTIVVYLYNYIFPRASLVNIAIALGIYCATYSLSVWASPLINPREKDAIARFLKLNKIAHLGC